MSLCNFGLPDVPAFPPGLPAIPSFGLPTLALNLDIGLDLSFDFALPAFPPGLPAIPSFGLPTLALPSCPLD